MAIELRYLYRDSANYKAFTSVIFDGEITDAERAAFAAHLLDDKFIAEQAGLPSARDGFETHYDDDHVWDEFVEFATTGAAPTDARDIHTFVAEFVSATWDAAAAKGSLDTWMAETPRGH